MQKTAKDRLNLDDLLHPALAFNHPEDVARDPDLTLNEKRAILASWASDACALEAAPELRQAPSGALVRFDDIMQALQALDRQAGEAGGGKPWRRQVRGMLRRHDLERGRPLH